MGNKSTKHDAKLLYAAKQGDVYNVKRLVTQGVDKDVKDNFGQTPLMLASLGGYLGVVRYLVEHGADKDSKCNDGGTPLIFATWGGERKVVRYLIEQGADKDTKDINGRTALMTAALRGHLDVVRYLVNQGADKYTKDNDGKTSSMWASLWSHLDVMQYLADVHNDTKNKTPSMSSIVCGQLDVVGHLAEQGADAYGKTALIRASHEEKLDVIQHLLQSKADPTGHDKDDNSVLLQLLTNPNIKEDELLPVVIQLLKHGTPPLHSSNGGKYAKSVANTKGFHHTATLVKEYATKPQPAFDSREKSEPEDPSWYISPDAVAKVGAALAHGGFGTVYRARWAHSDVVVKEVLVVELRRFLKEVNTWCNLRHANVVPFYGANHGKEPYFIVSEYASNGELVPYLERQKLKGRNLAWRKLQEVGAGLGYLHGQGVVHGDLKCNNIVVSDNHTAMLTDFGLSFKESGSCSVKKMKDNLGAMAWRAPEFAHMTVMTPTCKSDVYSLGMCIIEAVTFKNPWSGYSNERIREFLRNGEIKANRPDEMTDPQWELVKQMIAVSPNDRPDLSYVIPQLTMFAEDEEVEEADL